MASVGIRELKNHLSRYLARVRSGERITVTDRGLPIAELHPVQDAGTAHRPLSKLERLVEAGRVRPALRKRTAGFTWPAVRLPPGTAVQLIDELRDDTPER